MRVRVRGDHLLLLSAAPPVAGHNVTRYTSPGRPASVAAAAALLVAPSSANDSPKVMVTHALALGTLVVASAPDSSSRRRPGESNRRRHRPFVWLRSRTVAKRNKWAAAAAKTSVWPRAWQTHAHTALCPQPPLLRRRPPPLPPSGLARRNRLRANNEFRYLFALLAMPSFAHPPTRPAASSSLCNL